MEQSARGISHDRQQKWIEYWHGVDAGSGRRTGALYTPDVRFGGAAGIYEGRARIEALYGLREGRGAPTDVHSVANVSQDRAGLSEAGGEAK